MFQPSLFITNVQSGRVSHFSENQQNDLAAFDKNFPRPDAVVLATGVGTSSVVEVAKNTSFVVHQVEEKLRQTNDARRFSCKGSPELARIIVDLMKKAGRKGRLVNRKQVEQHFLAPLRLLYGELYFPIVPLFLPQDDTGAGYMALGRALTELRQENVLIAAEGFFEISKGIDEADAGGLLKTDEHNIFMPRLYKNLEAGDWESVLKYQHRGPPGRQKQVFANSMAPLFFAMGAGGEKAQKISFAGKKLSVHMDGYQFTDA